jgi:hypothetical protein
LISRHAIRRGQHGAHRAHRAHPGVFYHVLPDLPIAQIMFLGGIGLAALGVLGLSRPAAGGPRPAIGGRWLRGRPRRSP